MVLAQNLSPLRTESLAPTLGQQRRRQVLTNVANWTRLMIAATRPVQVTAAEAMAYEDLREWKAALTDVHPEDFSGTEPEDRDAKRALVDSWSQRASATSAQTITVLSAMNIAQLRAEAQAWGFDISDPKLQTKAQLTEVIRRSRPVKAKNPLAGLYSKNREELRTLCKERGMSIENELGKPLLKDQLILQLQGWTAPESGTQATRSTMSSTGATSSTSARPPTASTSAGARSTSMPVPKAKQPAPPAMCRARAQTTANLEAEFQQAATPQPGVQQPGSPAQPGPPKCTLCDLGMIIKRNSHTQELFWSCVRFPRCRVTRPLEAAEILNPTDERMTPQSVPGEQAQVAAAAAEVRAQAQELRNQQALVEQQRAFLEQQQEAMNQAQVQQAQFQQAQQAQYQQELMAAQQVLEAQRLAAMQQVAAMQQAAAAQAGMAGPPPTFSGPQTALPVTHTAVPVPLTPGASVTLEPVGLPAGPATLGDDWTLSPDHL